MAALDDFFERAITIARDIGKTRTQRRQKQQDIENISSNKALALEERRVATGEKRAGTFADLGQQEVELGRAELAVRKQIGLGQLDIGKRGVGVQEGSLAIDQSRFKRSSALFNRIFPQGDKDKTGGITGSFRSQSDQGVLAAAGSLARGDKSSVLRNPRVQEVIRQAKQRSSLKNTLEQDLLSLR